LTLRSAACAPAGPFVVGVAAAAAIALAACGGSGSPTVPNNAGPGLRVFDQAACGTCHTLAAAHSTGTVGKKLDGARLDVATVEHWVRTGGGGMPTFTSQLNDAQIQQVAEFVSKASQ
jgi:mono/diheme cytochrome c family protein